MNLAEVIIKTPLLRAMDVGETCIYLKPENLQIYGSYKIRGIASVVADADPVLLNKGLSAASAGNMAQAVAYASQRLNIPCHIFIPDTAPDVKKGMISKLGARLIELPYQEVWRMVKENNNPFNDGIFIHPALNESLRQGYSNIANEIIADKSDVDAIVIPFGVGGLSLGVGMAMRKLKPSVSIYACEPETAAPLRKSLDCGKASSIERVPSFVDAIGTPEVLSQVFEMLAPILRDSLVIPLTEIKWALKSLLFNNKILAEGAAACCYAAAIQLAKMGKHKKIVCIISGGNVSADVLQE